MIALITLVSILVAVVGWIIHVVRKSDRLAADRELRDVVEKEALRRANAAMDRDVTRDDTADKLRDGEF